MNVNFLFVYTVCHLTSIRIFVKLSHFLLKFKNMSNVQTVGHLGGQSVLVQDFMGFWG